MDAPASMVIEEKEGRAACAYGSRVAINTLLAFLVRVFIDLCPFCSEVRESTLRSLRSEYFDSLLEARAFFFEYNYMCRSRRALSTSVYRAVNVQ